MKGAETGFDATNDRFTLSAAWRPQPTAATAAQERKGLSTTLPPQATDLKAGGSNPSERTSRARAGRRRRTSAGGPRCYDFGPLLLVTVLRQAGPESGKPARGGPAR